MERTSYAWGPMLSELQAAGVGSRRMSEAMGGQITDRMLRAYASGIQPMHWRGEVILAMWCEVTGKAREQAPRVEVVIGRRASRVANRLPAGAEYSAGYLTAWAQIGVAQVKPKNKGGRPRKVKP